MRRAYRERGLTQEWFADCSGFSLSSIFPTLKRHRNPTAVTLFELADAIGVTLVVRMHSSQLRFPRKPAKRLAVKYKRCLAIGVGR